eukprot:1910582-Pleurochrysis_carterae.AAC.5
MHWLSAALSIGREAKAPMSADPELDFELDISGDEVSPEKVLTLTQPTKAALVSCVETWTARYGGKGSPLVVYSASPHLRQRAAADRLSLQVDGQPVRH